jgi:hypothetical protein
MKVADSNHAAVTNFFLNFPNLSIRTRPWGMYQESSWGGGGTRPARKPDITVMCEPTVYKMREPRRLTAL